MAGRLPIHRDTAILLVVFLIGVSVVMVGSPATNAASPAAGAGQSAPSAGGGGTPRSTPADAPAAQSGSAAPTSTPSSSGGGGGTTSSTAQSQQSNRIKLMDSKYAQYAYPISGKSITPDAKRALDGFRRNRTRINETTVRVTLIPYESKYNRYSALVRDSQKLYFIESSMSDDGPKRETELNDDAPVKVDQNGYIIK